MGMHQMLGPISGSGSDYEITRSLRFNSADSAYLGRTFGSGGNRRTWTWSGWFKRQQTESMTNILFASYTNSSNRFYIGIQGNSDKLLMFGRVGGTDSLEILSNQVFRDFSAWYHMVVAIDSTQSSSSDRVKVYLNGSQISLATTTALGQNVEPYLNSASPHHLGRLDGSSLFNGYQAEVHFVDGQALTPSSFGEFDDDNNWIPKEVDLTYGTNGFYLNFSDNSSNSALGTDSSGNNNTFTVTNISVAAGTGNDSLIDTPTNYSAASGNNGGNYSTWNPLDKHSGLTLKNGNLVCNGADKNVKSTISVSSGKWYFENQGRSAPGIQKASVYGETNERNYYYYGGDGKVYANTTGGSYNVTSGGATYNASDVVGIAMDLDNNTLKWYKNGTLQSALNQNIDADRWCFMVRAFFSEDNHSNFGQRPFAYTPPAGYKALCTANLPDPGIAEGSPYFQTVLWDGNGSSRSITTSGMSPDWVWIKERGVAGGHNLYDAIRGATKFLASEDTAAEGTDTSALTAFNSDGFSLGTGFSVKSSNKSGRTYAGWCWDAGSSTVTNTSGSVNSSVRANPTAGFSIAAFTVSSDGNVTVGHGLGAVPEFIIVKRRTGSEHWYVHHTSLASDKMLKLESTGGVSNSDVGNSTLTNTLFNHAANAGDHIAYCFTSVAGYSAFGSYTGNGSANGVFVHTGFRPAFLLYKRTDSSQPWYIVDTARDPDNIVIGLLSPNSNAAEDTSTGGVLDLTSNGFKARASFATVNGSGGNYIYAAFAEHPFKTARAR